MKTYLGLLLLSCSMTACALVNEVFDTAADIVHDTTDFALGKGKKHKQERRSPERVRQNNN